jgi:hypothetical protein
MLNDQARISVADSFHTGLVIVRGEAIHGRGLLLLNASETEARVKHLDGFVSVTFFASESCDTIGEYVQWRTPAHLAAAFRRPEFHEHLPVVASLAKAEVGFYCVERVVTGSDDALIIGPSFAGTVDLQVLQVPKENLEAAIARMVIWAEAVKKRSNSLRAVVVHADRVNAKAALLMHHATAGALAGSKDLAGCDRAASEGIPSGGKAESVWYNDSETSQIDCSERMIRYTTVSAPGANDRPLRYVMSPTRAHPS